MVKQSKHNSCSVENERWNQEIYTRKTEDDEGKCVKMNLNKNGKRKKYHKDKMKENF